MKKENLLIIKILLSLIILGITSCSNVENENDFDLNGKYTHLIDDCDNSSNSEINCIEFIEFNDSENVNVLIGGGDIVFQTKYVIIDSKVEFEKTGGLNFDISFTIESNSTLKRIEDSELWTND